MKEKNWGFTLFIMWLKKKRQPIKRRNSQSILSETTSNEVLITFSNSKQLQYHCSYQNSRKKTKTKKNKATFHLSTMSLYISEKVDIGVWEDRTIFDFCLQDWWLASPWKLLKSNSSFSVTSNQIEGKEEHTTTRETLYICMKVKKVKYFFWNEKNDKV